MAIFLGNKQPEWPNRAYPSPLFPHFGQRQYEYRHAFLPGFSDDAATGSTIRIKFGGSGTNIEQFDYYDKAGDAITDGVWGSGLVPGDCATAADSFNGFYMDDTDALLYVVVNDNAILPDAKQLVSVNKAGVIGTFSAAWETTSGTSFDGYNPVHYTNLIRTADGSGDFKGYYPRAVLSTTVADAIGNFRGAVLTFDEDSGAMTEAHLLPDTALTAQTYSPFDCLMFGPTSNNIMGGIRGEISGTGDLQRGPLVNISTGVGLNDIVWPIGAHVSMGDNPNPMGGRWRGYYYFVNMVAYPPNIPFFKIAEVDNMVDEMAVKYGLL